MKAEGERIEEVLGSETDQIKFYASMNTPR